MSVKLLLEKEINRGFEKLNTLEIGSEEYEKTASDLGKLLDKYNAMEQNENDYLEKSAKLGQMDDEKKDRKFKNWISVGSVVGGAFLTIWGTLKTLKFEETGTVTTIAGRAHISKLFPKK
ncbi:MAG: hypothetical protein UHD64_02505 [Bacteroidales bacterium]|nr:hypothetical protein [Bacteroidales bacterium]